MKLKCGKCGCNPVPEAAEGCSVCGMETLGLYCPRHQRWAACPDCEPPLKAPLARETILESWAKLAADSSPLFALFWLAFIVVCLGMACFPVALMPRDALAWGQDLTIFDAAAEGFLSLMHLVPLGFFALPASRSTNEPSGGVDLLDVSLLPLIGVQGVAFALLSVGGLSGDELTGDRWAHALILGALFCARQLFVFRAMCLMCYLTRKQTALYVAGLVLADYLLRGVCFGGLVRVIAATGLADGYILLAACVVILPVFVLIFARIERFAAGYLPAERKSKHLLFRSNDEIARDAQRPR